MIEKKLVGLAKFILMLILRFFIILSVVFIVVSCEDTTSCNSSDYTNVKIKFQQTKKGVAIDTVLNNFSIYGLNTLKGDSFLYKKKSALNISLPLSGRTDSVGYVFVLMKITPNSSINDTSYLRDTLYFYYTREVQLLSTNCGFTTKFTLDSLGLRGINAINPLEGVSKTIDNLTETNVKIFF